ncbi:hypothetical protein [Roseomonas genomospecies 6]|uniref:Uncharacterized protein n=1 Tax=Roseomonas genomospecies 6 TaxID=214106 RepID=A0A9W7TXW8_9PROT|nr:hypothetical protein [Roseomonas genomospecies 6]KAA0680284.1 hypothetical protein DS843_13270 [Roseomonas genomospecies 6]
MPFDFDRPQFSTQELLACVPSLTHDSFKQWLKRNVLSLSVGESIGKGRRPQYNGTDVIQVGAAYELSRLISNTSKIPFIWRMVIFPRVVAWMTGLAEYEPRDVSAFMMLHPVTGDVHAWRFSESTTEGDGPLNEPETPDALILFRIDRFIGRMIQRMERVKAGLPAVEPIKVKTDEEAEMEYLEQMGALGKDEEGRRILVGLSFEETEEYFRVLNRQMEHRGSDGLAPYASWDEKDQESERYMELHDKHERARLAGIFNRMEGQADL